jgi:hypothetical protein
MTLDEIVRVFAFLAKQAAKITEIDIKQVNSLLKIVDYDLISELWGHPDQPTGFETQWQLSEYLRPFKSDPTTVALTTGVGSLPADYLHWIDAYYVLSTETKQVKLETSQESVMRRENSIIAPTADRPMAEIFATQVRVWPTTISSINLVYLKRPTPAVYAVKWENGAQIYDSASSTQPQWGAEKHIDIIRIMLKYVGLEVGNGQIVAYLDQEKAKEN